MVSGVPEHAHCEMCGTPVTVGERRCGSAACEEKFQESIRAKKRGMYLLIGILFAAMMMSVFGRGLL